METRYCVQKLIDNINHFRSQFKYLRQTGLLKAVPFLTSWCSHEELCLTGKVGGVLWGHVTQTL